MIFEVLWFDREVMTGTDTSCQNSHTSNKREDQKKTSFIQCFLKSSASEAIKYRSHQT